MLYVAEALSVARVRLPLEFPHVVNNATKTGFESNRGCLLRFHRIDMCSKCTNHFPLHSLPTLPILSSNTLLRKNSALAVVRAPVKAPPLISVSPLEDHQKGFRIVDVRVHRIAPATPCAVSLARVKLKLKKFRIRDAMPNLGRSRHRRERDQPHPIFPA